mmetsp:Transcript_1841/g.8087  ORF Transcript_1841/g.8087 Transcript_1841/m.8087 type:complete len:336 (+) Transcript_1841:1173-2180(+)
MLFILRRYSSYSRSYLARSSSSNFRYFCRSDSSSDSQRSRRCRTFHFLSACGYLALISGCIRRPKSFSAELLFFGGSGTLICSASTADLAVESEDSAWESDRFFFGGGPASLTGFRLAGFGLELRGRCRGAGMTSSAGSLTTAVAPTGRYSSAVVLMHQTASPTPGTRSWNATSLIFASTAAFSSSLCLPAKSSTTALRLAPLARATVSTRSGINASGKPEAADLVKGSLGLSGGACSEAVFRVRGAAAGIFKLRMPAALLCACSRSSMARRPSISWRRRARRATTSLCASCAFLNDSATLSMALEVAWIESFSLLAPSAAAASLFSLSASSFST